MGTSRRIAALVALLLFTGVAVQATVCELLCAPAAHMPEADDGTAETAQPACHGASDGAAVLVLSAEAYACSDHAADPLRSTVRGGTARNDGFAPAGGLDAPPLRERAPTPVVVTAASADPSLRVTPPHARAFLTVVLRI